MNDRQQQRIVVGVSGSQASRAALAWAAREAGLRHAALHLVHAWDPAPHRAPYARCSGELAVADRRKRATGRLAAAVRMASSIAPSGAVTGELAEGAPERVLVRRSAGADLLVVGATAAAGQAEWSAGPVVRACLAHAACPIVIISVSADLPAPARDPLVSPALSGRLP